MADINALIAQGGTPLQIENPVNQFAKLQALRSAQQEQQLNALKLQEALTEQAEASTKLKTANIDLATKKVGMYTDQLKDVNDPASAAKWMQGVHNDPDLKPVYDSLGATTEQSLKTIPNVDVNTPEGKATFDQWKLQTSLNAEKFATHMQQQATAAETARHNQAMESIGKERADAYTTRMRELSLNAKDYPFVSEAIANGKLNPARINSRNAGILNDALKLNPDLDVNQLTRMAISGEAGARTLGTTAANQAAAGEEAGTMIPIARQYANLVNSGQFKSLNALGNFAASQTGDKDIVRLNTALNSLVNSYARAINPKGIPTVSDKNHAREVLDAALSKGQLNSALDVMEQEIAAARAGTEAARTAVVGGKPTAGAAPAAAPAAVPNIQSLLDKYK